MEKEKRQLGDVVWWHSSQQQCKAMQRYSSCRIISVMNSHKSLLSVLLLLQDCKAKSQTKIHTALGRNSMVCCSHSPFRERNVDFTVTVKKELENNTSRAGSFLLFFFPTVFQDCSSTPFCFDSSDTESNPAFMLQGKKCHKNSSAENVFSSTERLVQPQHPYHPLQTSWSLSVQTSCDCFTHRILNPCKNARLKIQQSLRKNTFLSKPDLAESEAVPAVTTRQAGLLHRGRVGGAEVPSLLII